MPSIFIYLSASMYVKNTPKESSRRATTAYVLVRGVSSSRNDVE